MNRIICPKGHFYDADKYPQCPHCMEGTAAVSQDSFAFPQSGAWEQRQGGSRGVTQKFPEDERDRQVTLILPVEYLPDEGAAAVPSAPGKQHVSSQEKEIQAWAQEFSRLSQEAGEDNCAAGEAQTPEVQSGERTVFDLEEVLPPVGYLVCIGGREYGRGFPLKTGVNTVKGQAHILYEPRRREFYLKPADNASLCYHNDEVLLEPEKLQAYDRITVGDTVFLLIAVCGEEFCWEELDCV